MNLKDLNPLRWQALLSLMPHMQLYSRHLEKYLRWQDAWKMIHNSFYSVGATKEWDARVKAELDSIVRPLELEDLEVPDVTLEGSILIWETHPKLSHPGVSREIQFHLKVEWSYHTRGVQVYPIEGSPVVWGSYCHPHVSAEHKLCLGEGVSSILTAFLYGSPLVGIQLVNLLLATYNADSPYKRLAEWLENWVRCTSCSMTIKESQALQIQGEPYCRYCAVTCNICGKPRRVKTLCPTCDYMTCLLSGRKVNRLETRWYKDGRTRVFLDPELGLRTIPCRHNWDCIGTALPARCTVCHLWDRSSKVLSQPPLCTEEQILVLGVINAT